VAVLDGPTYSYFRYQMHQAIENARTVHAEAAAAFEELTGRRYGSLEEYRLDDAEFVLVMLGSFATKGKAAVNRWREAGKRVGLLRLRLVRPWPAAELRRILAGRRAVGVIDQNISPGLGGILFHELAGALSGLPEVPVLRSFIGGLGGKDLSAAEFDHVLNVLESADSSAAGPELLMTASEWDGVRQRLAIAGKDEPTQEATS
jgi:pyruvate ferredoxin oxidoreductase alpha subunit